VETLYPARSRWTESLYENSKQAALLVQEELVKSSGLDDLGVKSASDNPGFNWSKVPVVETQAGFLSNEEDDRLLADDQFRWKVAWGLRNGIRKYLNNLKSTGGSGLGMWGKAGEAQGREVMTPHPKT